MVRGFALFGVLLVNMYGFGADSIAWNVPTDQLAFAIMRVFFESKSWTLFSMLFGFGFAVQLQRAHARGFRILPIYLRRLAVLFAFGAAHALLYDGDILMLYAELGLGLLVVRRLPTRRLLLLAVGLMLVFPLARLTSARDQLDGSEKIRSVGEARARLERAQRTHVYATGSLAEVAADNASAIPADPLEDVNTPESGLAVFAMFLLGFSVGRSGVLRDIPGHAAPIARMRAWGLGFGLAAMAAERVLAATAGYAVFRLQRAGPGVQFAGADAPRGLFQAPQPFHQGGGHHEARGQDDRTDFDLKILARVVVIDGLDNSATATFFNQAGFWRNIFTVIQRRFDTLALVSLSNLHLRGGHYGTGPLSGMWRRNPGSADELPTL